MPGIKSNIGSEVSDFVRIGQVSSVNAKTCSCRVAFDDLTDIGAPMTSYPLQIVQRRTVKCQKFDLPEVGEHVLCLFLPNGNQEGFVLGSFYTANNLPAYPIDDKDLVGKAGIYRTHYDDDTEVEFDLNTSTQRVYTNHADVEFGRKEGGKLVATGKTTIHIKVNGDDGNVNIKFWNHEDLNKTIEADIDGKEGLINLKTWNHDTEQETAEVNIDGYEGTIDIKAKDKNSGDENALVHMDGTNKIYNIDTKKSESQININSEGTLNIHSDGAMTITSNETITIEAPRVDINP